MKLKRALANSFHDRWVSSAAVDPRRSDIHAFRRMRCPLAWFGRRAPVRGSVYPGDVDTDRLDGRPDRRESGTAKVSTRRPRCPHDARFVCTLTAWWLEKMTDGSCTVPMIVIRIFLAIGPSRGARSVAVSTRTPFSSQRLLISGHRVPCSSIQRVRVHGVIASTSSRACKFPPRPHRTSLVVSAEIRFLACLPTRTEPGTSDRPRGRPRGSVKSAEFLFLPRIGRPRTFGPCRSSHRPR